MTRIVSFYRFVDVAAPAALRDAVEQRCRERQLLGTVLVAGEGVNGTLAGAADDLRDVLDWLGRELGLEDSLERRWTEAAEAPFRRLRVSVKPEIVRLGREDIRPQRRAGRHLSPAEWHALLDDPETLLVDTRNRYEVEVGSFPGAVDPGTDSFRQFPAFAETLAQTARERPVAMFCTGGIRCEKASALLMELGFERVYQLRGGILNYLATVDDDDNRWRGECFVFDKRVAVDRDLAEGGYEQCHACRRPLGNADLASPLYREGVSCPHCAGSADEARTARLEERRRQVRLARERGEKHIGARPGKPGRGETAG